MLATFPLTPCKLHKHWVNKRPFHVRLGWNHFVSRGKISHFGFKCFMWLWHLIVSQWYTARCLPITNISFQDMTVDQNSIGSSHIVQIYQVPSARASSIISVSISRSLSNYKLERRCDRDVYETWIDRTGGLHQPRIFLEIHILLAPKGRICLRFSWL